MSGTAYWLAEWFSAPLVSLHEWLVPTPDPEPLDFSSLVEAQAAVASSLGEASDIGGAALADSGPEQAPLVPLTLTLAPRAGLTFVDLEPSFVKVLLQAKDINTLGLVCPTFLNHYLVRAELASDPRWPPPARAARAFRAGVSAARVVAGDFHKQAASLGIGGDNRHYIVLACRQLPGGFYTQDYLVYITYLGTDSGSLQRGSVSHAFGPAVEVEIFLRGAHRQWPVELHPEN